MNISSNIIKYIHSWSFGREIMQPPEAQQKVAEILVHLYITNLVHNVLFLLRERHRGFHIAGCIRFLLALSPMQTILRTDGLHR